MKKRKVNLPLIEVIIVSLIVHVVAIVVLGGITIYTALMPEEPELEAPPPPERIEPQKLQHKVQLQKQQKKSQRPPQKITVQQVSQINMPTLDLDIPTVDTRVSVGTANFAGAGGIGGNRGGAGIEFSKSSVDFFGIKSSGERVFFIVDASKYMLVDEKGGIPAYNIIKDEITMMVNKLAPGTLFNVMFYDGSKLSSFSSKLIPATTQNKERFKAWIQPINKDFASIGKLKSNTDIVTKDIEPMTDKPRYWVRALQSAMEQGSDTINILVSSWQFHGRGLKGDELTAWYKSVGWGEKEEAEWDAHVKKAQEWLKNENKKRRDAGKPERVVTWIGTVVSEQWPKVRRKPAASFSVEEVMDHIDEVSDIYYRDQDLRRPPVNVVLFLGKEQDPDSSSSARHFEDLVRKNRGRMQILEGMEALKNVTGAQGSS